MSFPSRARTHARTGSSPVSHGARSTHPHAAWTAADSSLFISEHTETPSNSRQGEAKGAQSAAKGAGVITTRGQRACLGPVTRGGTASPI